MTHNDPCHGGIHQSTQAYYWIYIVVLQTNTLHFPDISKKIEIPAANIPSHAAVRARYVFLRFSAMTVTLID